ncbi:protein NRT1/ PTR FAMILY 5.8-like [Papaver somniferum]|uniref:protein NRT1/ PTR FAMILY 5.8-like n=1 Tax=Papaver somniferum TaxID=3469 RepID=UPI000E6F57DA|nr:protein NRT1/ PTR FAMILY 5.8-like [Papaver somniferum]
MVSFKGLGKSCILVIVVAGIEKFAFKGIQSNLVTYLTEVVKMNTSTAVKIVNIWFGVSYSLPIIGAFLVDYFTDRYSALTASSLLYVSGLVALTSTAFAWDTKSKIKISNAHEGASSSSGSSTYLLFLSLLLLALGQGGYNPCLQAFGADQLHLTTDDNNQDQLPSSTNITDDGDENDEIDSNDLKRSKFFRWYYFSVCSGTLLGVTLLSYLQEILGWGIGYAVPTIVMAISVAPFFCGTRLYTVIKKPKSAKQNITPLIKNLAKSIKGTAQKFMNRNKTLPSNSPFVELRAQQKPPGCSHDSDDQQSDMTNKLSADVLVDDPIEEKKSLVRLIPTWMLLLVFSIILQQPATFFTKQGTDMKRKFGSHFIIPSAALQGVKSLTIIFLVPVYDKIVTPVFRIISQSKKRMTIMQRMGFGLFLSVVAMCIAAVIETQRMKISRREPNNNSAQLNIFWLVPQYIIMGMAEVFTIVGMQEFFYSEVPNKLKTLGMALPQGVFGVGSFLSAILISILDKVTGDGKHSWFSDDRHGGHLDRYYWLLAISSAINLLCFTIYSRKYYN